MAMRFDRPRDSRPTAARWWGAFSWGRANERCDSAGHSERFRVASCAGRLARCARAHTASASRGHRVHQAFIGSSGCPEVRPRRRRSRYLPSSAPASSRAAAAAATSFTSAFEPAHAPARRPRLPCTERRPAPSGVGPSSCTGLSSPVTSRLASARHTRTGTPVPARVGRSPFSSKENPMSAVVAAREARRIPVLLRPLPCSGKCSVRMCASCHAGD